MDGATVDFSVPQRHAISPFVAPRRHAKADKDSAVRLDLLEEALERAGELLSRVPDRPDGQAARLWLAEADVVLGMPVDFDRSDLRWARDGLLRRAPADSPEASSILSEEAMDFIAEAVDALYRDEVSGALELAVKGLIAFHALPEHFQDRVGEARMASALGGLCCAFFDHERALRFYQIAASVLSPATDRPAWTLASSQVADLALIMVRELGPDAGERRAELLTLAEQTAHRLGTIGEPRHVVAVSGRRLLADVRCEQGAPEAAWHLLELADRAVTTFRRCSRPEAAAREAAALNLARGRCLHLLARTDEALVALDAALDGFRPDVDLIQFVEGLRLRSLAREAAGDSGGALRDARRQAEGVWARHQRQIGGFMDQVWGRAGAESHRRDLEEREHQLIRNAEQDPLTGLANRRGVERFCASLPEDEPICLVMIDIDHFKAINDRFGHAVGDAVLQDLAGVLAGSVRAVDLVSRWGGEEFLIALPARSAGLGTEAAERVLARAAEHEWSGVLRGRGPTVSAGVASGPAGDLWEVLERADVALYQAKRAGRNRVVTC